MTTTTTPLTAWLGQVLDAREAAARAAAAAPRPRGAFGPEDTPAGERWETRPGAGIHRGSGMLYVVGMDDTNADAALWDDEGGCDYMAPSLPVGDHIAANDPAAVLAMVEGLRAIVADCGTFAQVAEQETDLGVKMVAKGMASAGEITLRHVAAIFRHEPGYDEAVGS